MLVGTSSSSLLLLLVASTPPGMPPLAFLLPDRSHMLFIAAPQSSHEPGQSLEPSSSEAAHEENDGEIGM